MENNVAAALVAVRNVQVLAGIISAVKLVDAFETTSGSEHYWSGSEQLEKVFFAVAVLERALDKDNHLSLLYSTC